MNEDCMHCQAAYHILDNPDDYHPEAVREAAQEIDAHDTEHNYAD